MPWPGQGVRQAGGQLPGLEEEPAGRRLLAVVAVLRRRAARGRGRSAPWWRSPSARRGSGSPGARCARTSDRPFLPASSSSSTTIGRKMSCSSKRKIAAGSCISTLVSSTNRAAGAPSGGPDSFSVRAFRVRARPRGPPRRARHLDLAPLAAQDALRHRSGTCCARRPSSSGRTCSSPSRRRTAPATAWSSSERQLEREAHLCP